MSTGSCSGFSDIEFFSKQLYQANKRPSDEIGNLLIELLFSWQIQIDCEIRKLNFNPFPLNDFDFSRNTGSCCFCIA